MSASSADRPQRAGPGATELRVLCGLVLAALLASGIAPHDRGTWLLEVAPVLIGLPLALLLHRRRPLTALLWRLLALHALILIVGGHWTYARVPAGDWLKDALGLARNPYDRLGHLAQGFVPALLVRELLLTRTPLRPGACLFFLVTAAALAFSACYELIEWAAALVLGRGADDFLGTQGDPWDTQWDMFMALVGAASAQLLLDRAQDRELASALDARCLPTTRPTR